MEADNDGPDAAIAFVDAAIEHTSIAITMFIDHVRIKNLDDLVQINLLSRSGERTNPLFRGFGNQADEQAEQYDQPVLLRLGINDKDELRGGLLNWPRRRVGRCG